MYAGMWIETLGEEVSAGLAAAWDFSLGVPSSEVTDVSGNELHGRTVNKPTRGMTGWNWNGSETAWIHAPDQYGAIHFHDDDLYDAGFGFAVEDGPAGSFLEQFRRDYGMSFEGRVRDNTPWTRDVQRLVSRLAVVSNNQPSAVAGGGARLQRALPPPR